MVKSAVKLQNIQGEKSKAGLKSTGNSCYIFHSEN